MQACLSAPGSQHCPGKHTVYLTIDDGPDPATTPGYLKVLKQYGVHATFFALGRSLDANDPALVKQIVDGGHGLGIHSWSHDYELLYPDGKADPQQVAQEADRTLAKLRSILGSEFSTSAFRYPGGHMSWQAVGAADAELAQRGLDWVDWNSMFGDASSHQPESAEEMAKFAIGQAKGTAQHTSAIVMLLHDGPQHGMSVDALPAVIEWFQQRDYEFAVIT